MSWFSSRTANSAGRSSEQTTPALKQKHKQIESLREQFTGVSEVRRDEAYRLNVTVEGRILTLDITLPPRFPLDGPVVTVSPPIRHPWVNEQMVVDGSPLVKNFSTHSNLGRAIQQVVKEFNDHPPEFTHSQSLPVHNMAHHPVPPAHSGSVPTLLASNPVYYSMAPPSGGMLQNGGMPPYPVNPIGPGMPSPETRVAKRPAPPPPRPPSKNTVTVKTYTPPTIPESFEDVTSRSTEELERFLSESEGLILVDKYVSDLPLTKKLQEDRGSLFHENEAQANVTLSRDSELEEIWSELQDRCLQVDQLKSDYDKKLSEQRRLLDRYDVRGITSKMKTLAQEAETQSEIIAEDFLENKMSVKDFVQTYKQERVLHHLRKIKHENLTYGSRR